MATVVIHPADLSAAWTLQLDRRITRIGASSGNDIVLSKHGISEHHAHISYEGKHFTVASTDGESHVAVNGKRRRSHRLADGDLIQLGEHVLRFVLYDQALALSTSRPPSEGDDAYFETYRRFSERLLEAYQVPELLETLLDELISFTHADRAFLMLIEAGKPKVRVARNIEQSKLEADDVAVSDTVVQRVLETGESLIIADALSHADFKTSHSVVNLKLCSVMCVPLRARGRTLGLFYLGQDNIVNHFSDDLLETVGVFASTAALILADALQRDELQAHLEALEAQEDERHFGEIIGACDQMRDIYKKIKRVATTDISVLVEGETGAGKELVAKAIHRQSNRNGKPFIVINCGAIPENLLESELFGHVRGAFTGAVTTQKGKFQAASGGTLFLDEIGEMPAALQVKILRALQERTIVKVGDTKPEKIDIRVVAATNRTLSDEVAAGRFREDLYYRLNVINLQLPPLRERGDDIILLANYFLARYAQELVGHTCSLSSEAVSALRRWRWPGNIRELDNRIKKAIIFSDSGTIAAQDLDLAEDDLTSLLPLSEAREEWQRDYINRALALSDGNRTQAAKLLDVDPRTIFRHLERERVED